MEIERSQRPSEWKDTILWILRSPRIDLNSLNGFSIGVTDLTYFQHFPTCEVDRVFELACFLNVLKGILRLSPICVFSGSQVLGTPNLQ